jgi:hypothetical protein
MRSSVFDGLEIALELSEDARDLREFRMQVYALLRDIRLSRTRRLGVSP